MTKSIIMLHHSATWDDKQIADFNAIKAGHLAIGDRDIAYHHLIEYANGTIQKYKGREESDTAAACPGYNNNTIHVCVVGNFEESIPDDVEYQATAEVCQDIMSRWPIEEICGHRDKYPTACPGANFDVEHVKQLVEGGSQVVENVDQALEVLQSKGLISSKEYWKAASTVVLYLDRLIINIANYVSK